MRFVCIDFETNGFPGGGGAPRRDWPLPFSSYPIQLSVHIVDEGIVEHALTASIRGATQLAPWVRDNVPVSFVDLAAAKSFTEVMEEFAAVLHDGDVIVAHNVCFDLQTTLARAAEKKGIANTPAIKRILGMPRFCTMRCEYTRSVFGARGPKFETLCAHFGVLLENAHDAAADSAALAECVAEAWRRGVMLPFSNLV